MALVVAFICACGDESPVTSVSEDISEAQDDAVSEIRYSAERDAEKRSSSSSVSNSFNTCAAYYNRDCCNSCYLYYGTYDCIYCTDRCYDNYGNYICYSSSSSYRSSSSYYSSSSQKSKYLTSSKIMHFTLTEYRQVSSNWDVFGDGDPLVKFTVKTYADNTLRQTLGTGALLEKDNITSWSGTNSKELTINAGVDRIEVCPIVLERDDVSKNDDYSSGDCFSVYNVGRLEDYERKSQYDYNSNYNLEWYWYLYE